MASPTRPGKNLPSASIPPLTRENRLRQPTQRTTPTIGWQPSQSLRRRFVNVALAIRMSFMSFQEKKIDGTRRLRRSTIRASEAFVRGVPRWDLGRQPQAASAEEGWGGTRSAGRQPGGLPRWGPVRVASWLCCLLGLRVGGRMRSPLGLDFRGVCGECSDRGRQRLP